MKTLSKLIEINDAEIKTKLAGLMNLRSNLMEVQLELKNIKDAETKAIDLCDSMMTKSSNFKMAYLNRKYIYNEINEFRKKIVILNTLEDELNNKISCSDKEIEDLRVNVKVLNRVIEKRTDDQKFELRIKEYLFSDDFHQRHRESEIWK